MTSLDQIFAGYAAQYERFKPKLTFVFCDPAQHERLADEYAEEPRVFVFASDFMPPGRVFVMRDLDEKEWDWVPAVRDRRSPR